MCAESEKFYARYDWRFHSTLGSAGLSAMTSVKNKKLMPPVHVYDCTYLSRLKVDAAFWHRAFFPSVENLVGYIMAVEPENLPLNTWSYAAYTGWHAEKKSINQTWKTLVAWAVRTVREHVVDRAAINTRNVSCLKQDPSPKSGSTPIPAATAVAGKDITTLYVTVELTFFVFPRRTHCHFLPVKPRSIWPGNVLEAPHSYLVNKRISAITTTDRKWKMIMSRTQKIIHLSKEWFFNKRFIGNCCISSGMLVVGDIVQQTYEIFVKRQSEFHRHRIFKMGYAGAVTGAYGHHLYEWLDRRWPGRDVKTLTKKVILDNLSAPLGFLLFFGVLAIVERKRLQEFLHEIYTKGTHLYLTSSVIYAPAQYINFYFLAPQVTMAHFSPFFPFFFHFFSIFLHFFLFFFHFSQK